MNNIKFRVWALDPSKLTKPRLETRLCVINQKGQLYIYNSLTGQYFEPPAGNFVVQFFTGLKDFSEKEIFEGDIVALPFKEFHKTQRLISEVKWEEILDWWGEQTPEAFYHDLEIIGNIFENPELTEKIS